MAADPAPLSDTAQHVRAYPAAARTGPHPGLLWMHGGAFVGGSLDIAESDAVCTRLAQAGIACIAVDYRLVPGFRSRRRRHPDAVRYPLPLDDCERAWHHLRDRLDSLNVDRQRVHVGGASAGGALAVTLTMRLLQTGQHPPAGVVLAYPYLHAELPPLGADVRRAVRGPRRLGTFNRAAVRWIAHNYVGRDRLDLLAEALPGGADLTGFPPTLIVNSDRDTLRASGEAFADELRTYHCPVDIRCEPGTSHGHLNRPDHPGFERTLGTITTWLTR
ncbi:alpha/beta hydrolase [Nocardia fusca]|uniref:Alpha/beta hydrolase fold domain-containing protein n=1 Tax=Nocardia fusca TaxID=941183 RepID=A0ABV3FGD4_9NOCA